MSARRGAIVDRNQRPFAISVDAPSIYADPSAMRESRTAARALGRALDYSAAEQKELASLLEQDRSFVWIKRQVDPVIASRVRELHLEGVGFETESRRYYPKRDLLSPVLGYVGRDNQGMAGLEYAFLPVAPGYQSDDEIARFGELIATLPGPVLVFCRSGARSGRLYQAATGRQ